MIDFHIQRGGAPPYLQLTQQVKQALRLGWLEPGDKLPTVHEVAASAAVNTNTVLKAYKELEREGLATGRPGQGTYIVKSLTQLTQRMRRARRKDENLTSAQRASAHHLVTRCADNEFQSALRPSSPATARGLRSASTPASTPWRKRSPRGFPTAMSTSTAA